jgi:hypothetical protein
VDDLFVFQLFHGECDSFHIPSSHCLSHHPFLLDLPIKISTLTIIRHDIAKVIGFQHIKTSNGVLRVDSLENSNFLDDHLLLDGTHAHVVHGLDADDLVVGGVDGFVDDAGEAGADLLVEVELVNVEFF